MLQNWIKIAFRNFAKNKLTTFINIFGLTLGLIGLVLTILYWADQSKYDRWNPNKDSVYTLAHGYGKDVWGTSFPHVQKAKETISEIEDYLMLGSFYWAENISVDDQTFFQKKLLSSGSNFFEFFPFEMIAGNAKDALAAKNYIALSEDLAIKLFGDTQVIGKTIKVNKGEYIVNAVYKLNEKSSVMPSAVVPFYGDYDQEFNNFNYFALIKVKPNTDIKQVMQKYDKNVLDFRLKMDLEGSGLTLEEYKAKNGGMFPVMIPLSNIHFDLKMPWEPFEPFGNFRLILIMFGLSGLILILSIVNFINLTTANAIKRAKEIGVRKALGATRSNIVYQFLTETAIISLFALLLTFVSVEILLPYFNEFMGVELKMNSPLLFIQILLIVLGITLLAGIIPASYLSNFKAMNVLKGVFARSKKGVLLRNSMLFLQFLIATFFIIGTLLVYLQIRFLGKQDLGLNKEQIVILEIGGNDGNAFAKYDRIKNQLKAIPGIIEVNAARPTISMESTASSTGMELNGKSVDEEVIAQTVDFHYPEMMEMKLLKGRFLSAEYASDTINNIVINETLAKLLGIYDDPINKKLKGGQKKSPLDYNVVGMVQDYHIGDVQSKIKAAFMYHWKAGEEWMPLYAVNYIQVKFDTDKTQEVLGKLEEYWGTKVSPGYPFAYHFMDEQFAKSYETYTKQQQIFFILTFVVIFIALLGLFALSSLLIEQKLKDVAIRKTLGATSNELIFGLSKQYLIIGGIAAIVAMPLVYFMVTKWLEDFAYRIGIPIWPFLLSFLVVLVLAFLIVSIKALSATKINLVKYLKYE
jgi:putative ABC transport system permease protein